jgi:peptide/nickel transport system permease protein
MDQTKPVDRTMGISSPLRRTISRFELPDWVRSVAKNRKAVIGISILTFFVALAVFAPQISGTTQPNRFVARGHMEPGAVQGDRTFLLGTTRQGQDMVTQLVWGARTTLYVGFVAGTIITFLAIVIGLTSGYLGGWVDEALSLITNIFLILPGLPLIIVLASWLRQPGPGTVVLVLGLVNWAYGARVLRSQALALRNSEFVEAARVSGEPTWRIIVSEILPNMTSLVVSAWIGAILFAIITEAGLSFIGLGDANTVSWGTILYWAQQNQALLVGAWWTFIPPGMCIALVGLSLTLINYAIDEITNPRLVVEKSE